MSAAYRLALADALQLHDERVRNADVALRAARQAADDAEARLHAVMQARDNFKRAISDAESAQQGGRDTAAQSDEIEALRAEVERLRELAEKRRVLLGEVTGAGMADRARAEKLAEALRDTRRVGALLANAAYNLAQRVELTDRQRASLDETRKEWDALLREQEEGE